MRCPMRLEKNFMHIRLVYVFLLTLTCACSDNSPNEANAHRNPEILLHEQGDYWVMGDDILLSKRDPYHRRFVEALLQKQKSLQTEVVKEASDISSTSSPLKETWVRTWKDGVVPWFYDGSFTDDDKKNLQKAMLMVERASGVKFRYIPNPDTSDQPSEYEYAYRIKRDRDARDIGGSSTLGMCSFAVFTMVSNNVGVIVHEFLHGLGFMHEHQRPDRDKYITVKKDNIMDRFLFAFSVVPSEYAELFGPYDYDSIMHYDKWAFSKNWEITIDAKGHEIGQRKYLSGTDRINLVKNYGKPEPLADIKDHWAESYIRFLVDKQIVSGYASDGTFRPDNPLTRAEFATLIVKSYNPQESTDPAVASRDFNDIEGHWAAENIRKAARAGFIGGFPDKTFRPDEKVTKLQAILALANGLGMKNGNKSDVEKYFYDHWSVEDWAKQAVANAIANKLIIAYPDINWLGFEKPISRGELAAYIYQGLTFLGKAPAIESEYLPKPKPQ